MEVSNESINLPMEEPSLEDVAEDTESGESETTTEVAVSEKALKFKISTEGGLSTGRKSYPGSRKGSKERVQHLTSSELVKGMLKGKLRAGALSFDQHCLMHSKKSFDTYEFLDDSLKKRLEENQGAASDDEEDKQEGECVMSKETLNLNKRNSEHSVKAAGGSDEKKSILKCSDSRSFTNEEKLRMNNVACSEETMHEEVVSANNSSDNPNSISANSDTKNNRSIFSRFKQFTDRFSLSMDKDLKFKTLRLNSFKNNNQRGTLPNKNKSKLDSECCKNLDAFEERKASTLPKTKKLGFGKKGWKFLVTGKEKTECWSSDADVNKLSAANSELDNQSIPSTSKSQSSCTLNTSPKIEAPPHTPVKQIVDNNVPEAKLKELEADQKLVVVTNEAESNLI